MTKPPIPPADLIRRSSDEATAVLRALDALLRPTGLRVRDADVRWGDGDLLVLQLHIGPEFKKIEWTVWARFKGELIEMETRHAAERQALIAKALEADEFMTGRKE